ncbi:MAG TPA: fused MFS/spermidine synthase [Pyrinomonadaceae bacterium]|nr:fused MFS/spermidine synthase [Pyrinomonadaceae bacterium]
MSTIPQTARLTAALWHLTPLLTGAVIMVLELVAFRLYAPYFGYSIYVWGAMISVVMAALAAGYALGGWLADKSQTDRPLYLVILLSGAYQLFVVLTVNSLLPALSRLDGAAGIVLATLVIFGPPMVALAMVAPFVIRLQARAAHVGITAGKIYALSTIGSIGGVVITSFFLVPQLGTRATLITACAVTALVAVAGLVAGGSRGRRALLALPALALLPLAPEAAWPEGTIWLSESEYNQVRVVRRDNRQTLVLNHNTVHTLRDMETGWSGYYYDYFALGPALSDEEPRRLLVLGMGAGGSLAATRAAAPDIEADAVEIDPKVIEAGERFFDLRKDGGSRLRVHLADARPWLARSEGLYELVHIDLYQGGPYVPFYLATVEFFETVRAHMREGGVLMLNVMDVGREREILNSTAATLRRVFPTVLYTEPSKGNYLLFVFPRARGVEDVRARLGRVSTGGVIEQLARKAAASIQILTPPAGTPHFTDDHAPVEEMTRRMTKMRR